MSIINTLREKMGRLLVVIVGFSILAFVLTDLATNQNLFGGGARNVGEIDGEEISQEDFAAMVDNAMRSYGYPSGNPQLTQYMRDQVWQNLINQVAFSNKLQDLGLEISDNERVDMVQGKNLSPVMQSFFNQYLGSTEPVAVKNFLANINMYGPDAAYYFSNAEAQAINNRQREKFESLLTKTLYVTLAQAQQQYSSQFAFADVDYLHVPFSSVSDDQIGQISDAEISSYLNAHEDDYTVEESKDVEYVSFPVVPSAADSAMYSQQMAEIKAAFEDETTNDSTYAISMTEQGLGFNTYDPSALPNSLANNLTTLNKGDIVGPELQNGIYTIHKITDIVPSENAFARASQIVFFLAGKTPSEQSSVRQTARDVLRRINNGEGFEALAREYSDGQFSTSGGDLGWIRDTDAKVADVKDEVFGARRTGLINRLIERNDKIYIVNVTQTSIKNRYKVAQVIVEMVPSYETSNDVYLQAAEFAANVSNTEEFRDYAANNGYSVFQGTKIGKDAMSIGRLENARQIVTWLYGEASIGDVSDFDLDGEYVVAVYTNETEEGVQSVDDVRAEITEILKNEKKAEFIKSKLGGLSGTVSEVAAAYGPEAQVFSNQSVKMDDNSLGTLGFAPEAIGAANGLRTAGQKAAPQVVEGSGVVLIQLNSRTEASDLGDYTLYENELLQQASNRIVQNLLNAITEKIEVKDERYKFF
ncbi:MAG: SurA N-terminal domain-containing protein [Cytophagia bacterium]|nr:SurA N-terminal domain-containing protein [Cytophagia bacterium]